MKGQKKQNMLQRTSVAIDATDGRILDALQADAKLTNVELATRVHLSPSPCLARVRRLEEAGLISKYVALLDQVQRALAARARHHGLQRLEPLLRLGLVDVFGCAHGRPPPVSRAR